MCVLLTRGCTPQCSLIISVTYDLLAVTPVTYDLLADSVVTYDLLPGIYPLSTRSEIRTRRVSVTIISSVGVGISGPNTDGFLLGKTCLNHLRPSGCHHFRLGVTARRS